MRPVRPWRGRRAVPLALLALVASAPALAQSAAPPDRAQTPADTPGRATIADHVAEASRRFGVPESWIWAVMRIESAGDAGAVSTAGAMGLMQIMPDTWAYLRARYRLGDDPFDRRDNILGGTAYLRELHDRFGAPGFLAAYNAGPARYAEYLAGGRPLPLVTRHYVTQLAPAIGGSALPPAAVPAPPERNAWTHAALFPQPPNARPASTIAAAAAPAAAVPAGTMPPIAPPETGAPATHDAIFVALNTRPSP